jgi:hypothetical protein
MIYIIKNKYLKESIETILFIILRELINLCIMQKQCIKKIKIILPLSLNKCCYNCIIINLVPDKCSDIDPLCFLRFLFSELLQYKKSLIECLPNNDITCYVLELIRLLKLIKIINSKLTRCALNKNIKTAVCLYTKILSILIENRSKYKKLIENHLYILCNIECYDICIIIDKLIIQLMKMMNSKQSIKKKIIFS